MRLTVAGTRRLCGPPWTLSRSIPTAFRRPNRCRDRRTRARGKGCRGRPSLAIVSATTSDGAASDLLTGTLHGRPRAILRTIVLAVLRPLLSLRLIGVENVPCDGPLLVVSNHLSNADPIILEAAFPRPLFFLGKAELFRNPLFRWVLRRFGGIPLERGTADLAALRRARAVLEQGIALGIYPGGRAVEDRRTGQRATGRRSHRAAIGRTGASRGDLRNGVLPGQRRYTAAPPQRASRAASPCTSDPRFTFPTASTESESRQRRRRS